MKNTSGNKTKLREQTYITKSWWGLMPHLRISLGSLFFKDSIFSILPKPCQPLLQVSGAWPPPGFHQQSHECHSGCACVSLKGGWRSPSDASQVHVCLGAQARLTLCDPMDFTPPGSSVHGIPQERILEWVAISFSRVSSRPRCWTHVSYISCSDRTILYLLSHWSCSKWLQSYSDSVTLGLQPSRPLRPRALQARVPQWAPCSPPGGLPHLGIKPAFLLSPALAGGFFTTCASWEALSH